MSPLNTCRDITLHKLKTLSAEPRWLTHADTTVDSFSTQLAGVMCGSYSAFLEKSDL